MTVVAGRFELEAAISSGGMGTIHRARDRRTGARVAVKLGRVDLADAATRFAREARLLAGLDHPHVVRHVDHGVGDDGALYLAMEWLEGEDLQARLRRGPLTIAEVRALGQGLAEGLAHAHDHGVIHRDIKPSNLFLVGGDPARVKIVDFGVARAVDHTAVTRAGTVVGTPGYMAPEQARGELALDGRADLFGLGAVLFEALTGRPPFVARDLLALLFKILVEDPPALRVLRPDVPPALAAVVATLLAKDRARRPDRASVVAEVLAALRLDAGDDDAPATALTRDEQVLVCVILAPGAATLDTDASAPTEVHAGADDELRARLRRSAAPYGASLEWLAGGGWIAAMRGGGRGATDQVGVAARCALALHAELPDVPLAIGTGRAAIHASVPVGPVVDAAVALLRDPAARARPAPILVDDTTARLIEARFAIDGARLIGRRDAPAPARTLLGRPSPCVGRDRELAHLRALVEDAFTDRAAGAALVVGAAGIGKSRLVHELRGVLPDATVWSACGDPVAGGAPLSLLAQALRHGAGVAHDDPPEAARAALEARFAPAREPDVLELIAELVAASDAAATQPTGVASRHDPTAVAERIRRGLIQLIAAACARGPLLIVLDDLHWGDGATVRLLDAALGELDAAPLAIVGLARPEIHDAFPRLWAGRRVHELRLAGLRPRAATDLIRHALGDAIAEARVEALVARGDGNPFYLEELVRNVAAHGDDALPDTVLAMASARLEALDPTARQLLRAASVHGDGFAAAGVAALLDGARIDDVIAGLLGLADREVLVRDRDDLARFRFRHAFLRDAAYAMLTPADRALGHRLAAEWLARHAPEDAVLARHFARAGDPRAAAHYLAAAKQALRRSDPDGAVALAARGEAVAADARVLDELRRFHAGAETWRGDFRAVDALAGQMMAASRVGAKAWWSAAVSAIYAGVWLARPRALGQAVTALVEAVPAPDALLAYGRALGAALPVLYQTARHEPLARLHHRFVAGASPMAAGDPFIAAMLVWMDSAHAMFVEDDPWRALARCREAQAMFERAGDTQRALHLQGEVAMYLGDVGELDAHEADNRRVLMVTSHMGLGPVLGLAFLAYNLAAAGRIEAARELIGWPLARSRERGFRTGEGLCLAAAALIALHDGRLDDAHADATGAVLGARTVPRFAALAYAALVRARLAAGRTEGARRAARAGMAMLARHGVVSPTDAALRLARAEALAACHDPAAPAALADAHARVIARATRAPEPTRARYLTGVPWVARTIALAGG